ncbi:sensor histidine kinase [Trueperella sp. LYQ143]|uniref:sensor histidine kinase n=1 Tax=unclassified Trueperella TaxID=2630174 RepID=UPI0039834D80
MKRYRDYAQAGFLRFAMLLVGVTLLVAIFVIGAILAWTTHEVLSRSARQTCHFLDTATDQIESDLTRLSNEPALHQLATASTELSRQHIYQLIYPIIKTWPEGSTLTILDAQGGELLSTLYEPNRQLLRETQQENQIARTAIAHPGKIATGQLQSKLFSPHQTIGVLAYTAATGDPVLMATIGEVGVHNVVAEQGVDTVVITDEFNTIIWGSPTWESLSQHSDEDAAIAKLQMHPTRWGAVDVGGHSYFREHASGPRGMQCYAMTSTALFVAIGGYALTAMILLAIAALALTLIVAKRQADRLYSVVDDVVQGINQWSAQGPGYRLPPGQFTEFNDLYAAFNQSFSHIEELLERNRQLVQSEQTLRVKVLTNQFNPHFVFNILHILAFQIAENTESAIQMTQEFARFLRYCIHESDAEVPLCEDAELMETYLRLQQMRWGNRLKYSIEIPADIADARVPRLLLQPIIENALLHGGNRTKELTIRIQARAVNEVLQIEVYDDGDGMSQEKIAEIRHALTQPDVDGNHLGLVYVHRMISLLYGCENDTPDGTPDLGLTIDSAVGCGTRVRLNLPLLV